MNLAPPPVITKVTNNNCHHFKLSFTVRVATNTNYAISQQEGYYNLKVKELNHIKSYEIYFPREAEQLHSYLTALHYSHILDINQQLYWLGAYWMCISLPISLQTHTPIIIIIVLLGCHLNWNYTVIIIIIYYIYIKHNNR